MSQWPLHCPSPFLLPNQACSKFLMQQKFYSFACCIWSFYVLIIVINPTFFFAWTFMKIFSLLHKSVLPLCISKLNPQNLKRKKHSNQNNILLRVPYRGPLVTSQRATLRIDIGVCMRVCKHEHVQQEQRKKKWGNLCTRRETQLVKWKRWETSDVIRILSMGEARGWSWG